jgi:hypothetical protein
MNVKKRLAIKRYKKEEREAIMKLVWIYIWSASEQELQTNRAVIIDAIKLSKRAYI